MLGRKNYSSLLYFLFYINLIIELIFLSIIYFVYSLFNNYFLFEVIITDQASFILLEALFSKELQSSGQVGLQFLKLNLEAFAIFFHSLSVSFQVEVSLILFLIVCHLSLSEFLLTMLMIFGRVHLEAFSRENLCILNFSS